MCGWRKWFIDAILTYVVLPMSSDLGWIRRCHKKRKLTGKASRKEVLHSLARMEALIFPPLFVCANKAINEGNPLGALSASTLAHISSYLTGYEDGSLDRLVSTGRIHNDLLVAMARKSCHGRRLVLKDGRLMSTTLSCHRQKCQWRRKGRQCITWHRQYTRSSILTKQFPSWRPPRCWDGDVKDEAGRPVAFGRWVLEELTRRHRAVMNRR